VFTVRRAFANGRLKTYAKTARSRRRVPLRAKVVAALETLPLRVGVLFPASEGGRIEINTWRSREWGAGAQGARRRAPAHLRHAPHVRDGIPARSRQMRPRRPDKVTRGMICRLFR
jgi:integrase